MAKGLPARQTVQNHFWESRLGYGARIREPCRESPAGVEEGAWRDHIGVHGHETRLVSRREEEAWQESPRDNLTVNGVIQ